MRFGCLVKVGDVGIILGPGSKIKVGIEAQAVCHYVDYSYKSGAPDKDKRHFR